MNTMHTTPSPNPTVDLGQTGRIRRVTLIVIAAASLGVTTAFAVAAAQDNDTQEPAPVVACAANEQDLLQAANAARVLEAQRPDLYENSPQPATEDDLRLAAEWASRTGNAC